MPYHIAIENGPFMVDLPRKIMIILPVMVVYQRVMFPEISHLFTIEFSHIFSHISSHIFPYGSCMFMYKKYGWWHLSPWRWGAGSGMKCIGVDRNFAAPRGQLEFLGWVSEGGLEYFLYMAHIGRCGKIWENIRHIRKTSEHIRHMG